MDVKLPGLGRTIAVFGDRDRLRNGCCELISHTGEIQGLALALLVQTPCLGVRPSAIPDVMKNLVAFADVADVADVSA